jgi:hypothetical protein
MGGGVGLAALSYIVLFLGLAQGYRAPILAGVALGLLVLVVPAWKVMDWNALGRELTEIRAASPFVLTISLAFVLLTGFVMTFVPEVFYDSLVYHLGLPRWYLLEGGIRDFPNIHSKFPLLVQMLYVPALQFSGEAACKLMHWMFVPLTALLMMDAGRRWGRPLAGMIAAATFLSVPMGQFITWTTGIDMGTGFYVLMVLVLMVDALLMDAIARPWQILLGVAGGLTFATKYTAAMVFLFVYTILIAQALIRRRPFVQVLREALAIGFTATAMVLPWFLKNWLHTGNPVFPFLVGIFGARGFDPERYKGWMSQNAGNTPVSFEEVLKLPWTLTFEAFSGLSYPGPWLLAMTPVALVYLFRPKTPRAYQYLWAASFACVLVMTYLSRHTRYSLPFMAPWCLAIAWALCDRERSAVERWLVTGAAVLVTWLNAGSAYSVMSSYRPYDVLMGRESPVDFVSYTHPGMNPIPSTAMYEWMKKNLPASSRVFLFGDEQVAYCRIPFEVAGVFDTPRPLVWMDGVQTVEALHARITERRLTHIFVNWGCADRNLSYRIMDWPEEKLVLFSAWWDKHVRFTHQITAQEKFFNSQNPLLLFAILPEEKAKKTAPVFNPFLALYEKRVATTPEAQLALYEGLVERHPQVPVFRLRLKELKAQPAAR